MEVDGCHRFFDHHGQDDDAEATMNGDRRERFRIEDNTVATDRDIMSIGVVSVIDREIDGALA